MIIVMLTAHPLGDGLLGRLLPLRRPHLVVTHGPQDLGHCPANQLVPTGRGRLLQRGACVWLVIWKIISGWRFTFDNLLLHLEGLHSAGMYDFFSPLSRNQDLILCHAALTLSNFALIIE